MKRNVKGTQTQINDLDHKAEINIQPEQNEETRIQKNERLSYLQDILNVPTSEYRGARRRRGRTKN